MEIDAAPRRGMGVGIEVDATVFACNPFDCASHALCGSVNLAEISHFIPARPLRDCDCVAHLRDVDSHECFCILSRSSSSYDEDRLGHSEQPSKRANTI